MLKKLCIDLEPSGLACSLVVDFRASAVIECCFVILDQMSDEYIPQPRYYYLARTFGIAQIMLVDSAFDLP